MDTLLKKVTLLLNILSKKKLHYLWEGGGREWKESKFKS